MMVEIVRFVHGVKGVAGVQSEIKHLGVPSRYVTRDLPTLGRDEGFADMQPLALWGALRDH